MHGLNSLYRNYIYCRTCFIAWFNHCVLSFASEIVNLIIAFASHKACKVHYKSDTIVFPTIANMIETQFTINTFSQLKPILRYIGKCILQLS